MQRDERETIQELIEANVDLAPIVARQLLRELGLPRHRLEDLEGAGQEGLMSAAQRFDPSRGVPFRRFANHRVRGAMIDALRRESSLPRRARERIQHLESALDLNEGLEATPAGTPAAADQRLAEHLARLATALAVGLVNQTAHEDGEPIAVDHQSPEEDLAREQARQLVRSAVEQLPEQERRLVLGHYYEGRRFDEISAELGLSKSWGSRLHTRAIARLTDQLRALR